MNTIGWILILAGIWLGRAVVRGRVTNVGEDLSDAALAIVRGDTKGFTEVMNRVGEGFVPAVGVTGEAVGGAAADGAWAITGQLKYKLGKVKPHVAAAASKYGPAYGITDIGGFGGGSVPGSDHPKGLALDFMVSAKKADSKKRGDALAAALLADPQVKYVIWDKRIDNKDGKGWHSYSGPSDHTDHVHASFKEM